MTIKEMALLIQNRYNSVYKSNTELTIAVSHSNQPNPNLNFSIEKLAKVGFIPKNNFEQEIDKMLEFCHKHFKRND